MAFEEWLESFHKMQALKYKPPSEDTAMTQEEWIAAYTTEMVSRSNVSKAYAEHSAEVSYWVDPTIDPKEAVQKELDYWDSDDAWDK